MSKETSKLQRAMSKEQDLAFVDPSPEGAVEVDVVGEHVDVDLLDEKLEPPATKP